MTLGNMHPIVFQINEVERQICDWEEKSILLQKQHAIPSEWLNVGFDEKTHQFASDTQKETYQDIKRYQSQIKIYLNKIGLSRDILRNITMEINTCGDNIEDIYFQFISAHLKLVATIAKRHVNHGTGIEFLDLIHEGNIGLMKAIDNFDYQRGFQFKTYATWWIRQAVVRAMADRKHINGKIEERSKQILNS